MTKQTKKLLFYLGLGIGGFMVYSYLKKKAIITQRDRDILNRSKGTRKPENSYLPPVIDTRTPRTPGTTFLSNQKGEIISVFNSN